MLDMTVSGFASELASSSATPGGGGASALCGALAAALGSMVGRFPPDCGDEKTAGSLSALTARSEALRLELLELVDKDAEAFLTLRRALALPKASSQRESALESALESAAAAPLRILELCCEVIELMEGFASCGKAALQSDAGTGAVLAWGGMYGAALNVLVNTKAMKNRESADRMNARVDGLMNEYWKRADKTYEDVFNKLR